MAQGSHTAGFRWAEAFAEQLRLLQVRFPKTAKRALYDLLRFFWSRTILELDNFNNDSFTLKVRKLNPLKPRAAKTRALIKFIRIFFSGSDSPRPELSETLKSPLSHSWVRACRQLLPKTIDLEVKLVGIDRSTANYHYSFKTKNRLLFLKEWDKEDESLECIIAWSHYEPTDKSPWRFMKEEEVRFLNIFFNTPRSSFAYISVHYLL
jgi:hypothetical protein